MAADRTVGASEAKTHWAQLLDEVAQGAKITITRRGVPVAVLTPPPSPPRGLSKEEAEAVIEGFRELRKHVKPLGPDLTIRDLIEEGRRL